MYDEKFMRRAIALSARALDEPGARPYGAVVVKDGKIVGEGLNQSAKNFDPTSHGEVEAIRDACRNLKTTDLSGADLYTSCEPCSVCAATMLMAGIARMYYGATLDESGRIVPRPKMPPRPDLVRAQVGLPVESREMPAEVKLGDEAVTVLEAWVKAHAK
ncbi:MAG: guanine deaminase [Hyphomicrobiales bacterium]